MKKYIAYLSALCAIGACAGKPSMRQNSPEASLFFVGTYTQNLPHVHGKASGIYTCALEDSAKEIKIIDSATDIINPSFIAVSPNKKFLYAVSEQNGGKNILGKVVAYAIENKGHLSKINEVSSYGNAPCHISTDAEGKFVFVANYLTGNIASFAIKEDGGLSDSLCIVYQQGEKASFAHQVIPIPRQKRLLSVNKGADKLFVYDYTDKGILILRHTLSAKAQAGPRHFAFSPVKNIGFVVNENSSTVCAYTYDTLSGRLDFINELSTLPSDMQKIDNTGADIAASSDGRFVYVSNRGHNSIAIFGVDEKDNRLFSEGWESTRGSAPRNFMITSDSKYLLVANQNSDNIVCFAIDSISGKLNLKSVSAAMTPVCLKEL